MKMSKDDLLKKIDTLEIPDDTKVVLMEDVTDSFEESKQEDDYKAKYEDILTKYKSRFLDSTEAKEKPAETEEKTDEMEEKEVIDVKEI